MNASQSIEGLWPVWASLHAQSVDEVILAFTLVTLGLTVPIFIGMAWFAFRYRVGKAANRTSGKERSVSIELSWMLIPFVLTLIFFFWAARLFDVAQHPPSDAMTIDAIGKQWMWKFQHPGGQAEINDLHVPIDTDVRINMISQDVIHSLYVPALRIQMETLPNRYTQLWFRANRIGKYNLLCSEFCGTDHSVMGGTISIMSQQDYENWVSGVASGGSMAQAGGKLFAAYGCDGCHAGGSDIRAPSLAGLYGRPVPLRDGGRVVATEGYLRDKILYPDHHLIAGYDQVMPSYANRLDESDLMQMVAYLKTLGAAVAASKSAAAAQAPHDTPTRQAALAENAP